MVLELSPELSDFYYTALFIISESIWGEKVRSTNNILASGMSHWPAVRIKPNHVVVAHKVVYSCEGVTAMRFCHVLENSVGLHSYAHGY